MKDITNFLLANYPGRQWSISIGGGIADIVWIDGAAPADLQDGWDAYEPGPTIPQSVTPAQGLMALYVLHSITETDIQTAISGIEDAAQRYQATIAFTRATSWERTSESMGVVAQLMQLTEADLDAAFTLAATYTNL